MIPTAVIIAILALLIGSKKIKGQNDDRVHSKNSDADLARAMPNDSCLPPSKALDAQVDSSRSSIFGDEKD